MKKLLLLSFCTMIWQGLQAQSLVGESWQMSQGMYLEEAKKTSDSGSGNIITVPQGAKFTIVRETLDDYVIEFWNWKHDTSQYLLLNVDTGSNADRHFLVPKKDLDMIADKLYRRLSPAIGTMALPFKYRPQTGVFEPTFALTVVGGVNYKLSATNNRHSISFLFGVGPSSVKLNQYNTDSTSGITEEEYRAAVTMSLNMVYQWEQLQVGLSAGIDNKLNGNREHWIYQGKPWISVGIGVSVFSNGDNVKEGANRSRSK